MSILMGFYGHSDRSIIWFMSCNGWLLGTKRQTSLFHVLRTGIVVNVTCSVFRTGIFVVVVCVFVFLLLTEFPTLKSPSVAWLYSYHCYMQYSRMYHAESERERESVCVSVCLSACLSVCLWVRETQQANNLTVNAQASLMHNEFENYTFKISTTSLRSPWVKKAHSFGMSI